MELPPESSRQDRLHRMLAAMPAERFGFPASMAEGWLTDRYFARAAATLAQHGRDPRVTMQVFAKRAGVLGGVVEVVRMLQTRLAPGYEPRELRVETMLEGDRVNQEGPDQWESVMHIHGRYRAFAHLETTLLGVLAERSLVASNTAAAVAAAAGKPLLFMGARHADWRRQVGDGYAAMLGGATGVSTDAGGSWSGVRGAGTIPHALIAAFGGDAVAATLAFARYVREREPGAPVIALVDYENDVIGTSLAVADAVVRELGPGVLAGVRVDTSERMTDRSLQEEAARPGSPKLSGVNATLVRRLREALDRAGHPGVGIWVSGGFTPERIARFEAAGVPVAGYGVGSSLLGHNRGDDGLLTEFDFTADIVCVDGVEQAKVGRGFKANPRMVAVDWAALEAADRAASAIRAEA